PSSVNRKRPLTDATMGMNTPKREYYQDFNPYQYMNMVMNPQPMFQSTPFAMRTDENQPPFMTGEFCSPMNTSYTSFACPSANSSLMSNTSSNDSGISENNSSSSCENTPSTSHIEKSTAKDDEVMFLVPSRLNHISKNKVTLAELKRRIAAPECLNSSFLGIYLRLRILDELSTMFNELQTPLVSRIQNNVPIHNELEVGMNHFSLITHTFGPINQSTWCNAFLNYAKMSLSMYQNRGMEQVNRQCF
ncbi:hypothetical protein Angca_002056, partial [Angiostrongylus cantonensis]